MDKAISRGLSLENSIYWAGVPLAVAWAITVPLLLGGMELNAAHIPVVFIVYLGALVFFYCLSKSKLLAFYYWVILLSPYLSLGSAFQVKASYAVVPLLLFFSALAALYRGRLVVLKHPLVYVIILYTAVILVCSVANLPLLTTSSKTYVFLWFVGVGFFISYAGHINGQRARLAATWEGAFKTLLWAGVIATTIGVLEYFWPDTIHMLYSPGGSVEVWGARGAIEEWVVEIKRVGSIIGSPNSFAAFLNICTVIALAYVFIRRKYVYLPLAVLFPLASLLLTTSRGGVLGLAVAVLSMSLYFRRYGLLLLFGSAVTAILLAVPSIRNIFIFESYSGVQPEHLVVAALGDRVFLWFQAFTAIVHNPSHLLFGFGPSNEVIHSATGVYSAHNIFLTNLHFYGVFGLAILSALTVVLFRTLLKTAKDDAALRFASLTTFFIFVVILAQSLTDDLFFFNTIIMWIVFPFLSMLVAASIGKSKAGR